jgi:hypothetical protein
VDAWHAAGEVAGMVAMPLQQTLISGRSSPSVSSSGSTALANNRARAGPLAWPMVWRCRRCRSWDRFVDVGQVLL